MVACRPYDFVAFLFHNNQALNEFFDKGVVTGKEKDGTCGEVTVGEKEEELRRDGLWLLASTCHRHGGTCDAMRHSDSWQLYGGGWLLTMATLLSSAVSRSVSSRQCCCFVVPTIPLI